MSVAPRGFGAYGSTIEGTDNAGTIKVAGFFGCIVRIGDLTLERGSIETTCSNGGGYATFVPEDIITGGELEIDILHDTQVEPPWGAPETIVITYPLRGTASTHAKKTFQGFLTSVGVSHPFKGEGMISKCKVKIAGQVTTTAAT